jgi:EAL domain-containing protein (putative c-di-GMP-specific phosphodiesterase class I)
VACIEQGPAQGIDTPIFVEFQPAAIYDPVYCLRTTVATAQQVGMAPENIVFTLSHPNRGYDIKHLQNILAYYRQRGFRVALGQLGSGLGSLELLQHLRPEFAWLSGELIRGVNGDPYRSVIARKLLEMAHRLRVETIGEGGLDQVDRAWLYEHGTDYVALDPVAPAPDARTAATAS